MTATLTKVSIAADGTSITLKDDSTYDATLASPATTGKAYVLWRYWTDDDYASPLSLSSAQITTILASGGLAFTPDLANLTETEDLKFTDGVHQVKYLPGQTLSGVTATFTPGSKSVTLSGATNIADLITADALVWVAVTAEGETKIFEIDSSGDNDNSELTLKTEFDGSEETSGDIVACAEADLKVLMNKTAEACIVESIGALTDVPGDCQDVENTLNKLIRWRFAADVKMQCLDYDGAHNLVASIGKYCSSGKCVCSP